MDRKLGNALLAEFLGTFALVFIGAAVVATLTIPNSNGSVVVPALGHGLIVLALVVAFGSVSGGHFNPAVTAAMLVAGKIPVVKSILYWIVQFAAAILGALVLSFLIGSAPGSPYGQTIGVMTGTNLTYAAVLEGIGTFLFVTVIYQVAINGKGGNLAPIAIGLMLSAVILAIGVYTGASVNPARTLGPALAAGDLSYVPAYFIGIFAGGILAGLFNGYLYKPE
ncbi:MAG: aquaporin [Anaerolineae bacterium]|nr:aquaporin [Anaerolineae bacterium]